jgi:hypothetical protein
MSLNCFLGNLITYHSHLIEVIMSETIRALHKQALYRLADYERTKGGVEYALYRVAVYKLSKQIRKESKDNAKLR